MLRKLEAGRAAFVRDLRSLADDLERLSLPDAGEVLTWLGPHRSKQQSSVQARAGFSDPLASGRSAPGALDAPPAVWIAGAGGAICSRTHRGHTDQKCSNHKPLWATLG
jgi:photosystem II stability/assembly factor-like uncharacterized protein